MTCKTEQPPKEVLPIDVAKQLLARIFDKDAARIADDESIETSDVWDSLAHMRIVMELETLLGQELDSNEILGLESVSDIALLLKQAEQG